MPIRKDDEVSVVRGTYKVRLIRTAARCLTLMGAGCLSCYSVGPCQARHAAPLALAEFAVIMRRVVTAR